jgi:aminoglycoside phosphotransferase (APT) family kinase protein
MPAAEVAIDDGLVRGLLAAQHPDLADLPLRAVGSGWDNAIFRLGDDLAVRLPRRAMAADLVRHELRWLPLLARLLPLPVPVPLRAGVATSAYPFDWSVCAWIDGVSALVTPPDDLHAAAHALGAFLAAMHQPAPADAPFNPYRGIPLAGRVEAMGVNLARLGAMVDSDAVRAAFADALAVPPWSPAPVWLHGDVHPGNLLVRDGALAGVIDFGDICAGDPASDFAVAWMMFPPAVRPVFGDAAGVDDETWARARGWALALGVAIMANSSDNPPYAMLGRRTLDAVLAK